MTSQQDPAVGRELEAMAEQFQDLLRSMMDVDGTLRMESVIRQATAAIPGASHAAISFARAGRAPETIFATGELPMRVDAVQYSLGEGPCVSALTQSDFVWVNDLTRDEQFPRFSPAAVDLGVRSMLSTRLFLSETNRAALNLYADDAGAFRAEHLPLAAIFGSYASLLLLNRLHEDRVMHLERALESNREIGVAMGLLMARGRFSQSDAFAQLAQASRNLNRRLRDVAAEVVQTGALPRMLKRARPPRPE